VFFIPTYYGNLNWIDFEKMDSDSQVIQTLCEKAVGAKFGPTNNTLIQTLFRALRLLPTKTVV